MFECVDGYLCRVLAEQAERAMKDQQTLLEHKESELQSMEEHIRLLEEQVSSLKCVGDADRDELSKLRATVAELDREKDELQMAVDEKTEQEASRADSVAARVSAASFLWRLWKHDFCTGVFLPCTNLNQVLKGGFVHVINPHDLQLSAAVSCIFRL